MIITWTNIDSEFQPAVFNGFILDTLGTLISSASVDPASDFFSVGLTVNGTRMVGLGTSPASIVN